MPLDRTCFSHVNDATRAHGAAPGLSSEKSKVLTAAIHKAMDTPEYGVRELRGHNTLWKVQGAELKTFLSGLAGTVGKVKFWDLPK